MAMLPVEKQLLTLWSIYIYMHRKVLTLKIAWLVHFRGDEDPGRLASQSVLFTPKHGHKFTVLEK